MTQAPAYRKAADLPPELQSIGTLNAYEAGRDYIRVACRLSDPNYEVGQLAILRISMVSFSVEIEAVFDRFFTAFFSYAGILDILVENSNVVRLRAESGWEAYQFRTKFLLEAFSLAGKTNFVLGDDGEIFRFDGRSAWVRDTVDGSERLFGMHGISSDRLYAVGRNGTVLKENEKNWERIDVGIGTTFRCALVEKDRVVIAGNKGGAGVLAGSEYVVFETGITSDILSICHYRGSTYFSDSDFGIHRLVDGAFEPVANLGYVYRVNEGENWLTAAAGEYIFQFDGSTWRGIELSYRDGYRAEAFDMSFLE